MYIYMLLFACLRIVVPFLCVVLCVCACMCLFCDMVACVLVCVMCLCALCAVCLVVGSAIHMYVECLRELLL